VLLRSRENHGASYPHTYTDIYNMYTRSSLCVSLSVSYVCVCMCVIYTHIIHPIPPLPSTRLSFLSLSLSLSDNTCPKILFLCSGGIKTKRRAHRLNDDYHKHGSIHGAPARLTMFIQTVYRRRVTRARAHTHTIERGWVLTARHRRI